MILRANKTLKYYLLTLKFIMATEFSYTIVLSTWFTLNLMHVLQCVISLNKSKTCKVTNLGMTLIDDKGKEVIHDTLTYSNNIHNYNNIILIVYQQPTFVMEWHVAFLNAIFRKKRRQDQKVYELLSIKENKNKHGRIKAYKKRKMRE